METVNIQNRILRRFPHDFMFQMNAKEWDELKKEMTMWSQIVTTSRRRQDIILRQYISNYAELSARIASLEKQMNRKFRDIHEALNYLIGGEKAPEIGFKQAGRNP